MGANTQFEFQKESLCCVKCLEVEGMSKIYANIPLMRFQRKHAKMVVMAMVVYKCIESDVFNGKLAYS